MESFRWLLFFIVLLLNTNLYSQKEYFNFIAIKTKDVAAIEKKFDAKEYFSKYKMSYGGKTEDYDQPKCYDRPKTDEFPRASVNYYYTKKDSIIRLISYHWTVNLMQGKYKSKKIENYNTEFDRIVKNISHYIGEPDPNQGNIELVEDLVTSEPQSYSSVRTVKWNYKNCIVTTILIWSIDHGQSFVTSIKWND